MKKKLLFTIGLLVGSLSVSAQTMEERSELPESCVSAPEVLNDETSELILDFDCQIFNYEFKVANAAGEVVFETKDASAKWNAADVPAGTYTWTLLGTIGNTIDYTHVKRIASVVVE